jgi:hypothetical protein
MIASCRHLPVNLTFYEFELVCMYFQPFAVGIHTHREFADDQRQPPNDGNKKPRAGFPDTGLVSFTMTCCAI